MAISEEGQRAASEAYCEHIRGLKMRMETAKGCYREALAAADGIRAVRYDAAGKGLPLHGDDAMAAAVQRIEAQGAAMAEAIAAWAAECEEFDALCSKLSPASSQLLILRYRNALRWRDVAERMAYSSAYVRTVCRDAALLELYQELPLLWR